MFCVRMVLGSKARSSFADRCLTSASSSAPQRVSMRILRPSIQPRFWSLVPECVQVTLKLWVTFGMRHQHTNAPHSINLLPMRGQRRHCRAAEKRDELAQFHSAPPGRRSYRLNIPA